MRPGSRLGRYELILPIGRGGMASVWAARLGGQAGFSKLVAIKTTLPHLAEITEIRRMLLDEARIAARLHHPNVVTIYELGDEAGVPFVVMEWLNCAALDQLLGASLGGPQGIPDPRLAARIMADACAGLHAAHELTDDGGQALGVVHRDVSPHNILISADGAVKVADFGIVKARGQLHRTAAGGDPRGRLSYMAPEYLTGEAVDRRADVFALGCTLHEAITGEMVFAGTNDAQVIMAIAAGRYEPQPSHAERAPGLFAIVTRAVARAPADRYPTAEAMRLALEEWLEQNAPPIATAADIAAFVRARVGEELDERQTRLRGAMTANCVPSSGPRRQGEAAPQRPPGATPRAPPMGSAAAGPARKGAVLGKDAFSPAPLPHVVPPAVERTPPLRWRAAASVAFVATLVALGAHATLSVPSSGSRESHGDALPIALSATNSPPRLPARREPPAALAEPTPAVGAEQTPDAAVHPGPAWHDRAAAPPAQARRSTTVPSDDLPVNPY